MGGALSDGHAEAHAVHHGPFAEVFELALHHINDIGSMILLFGVAVALFNFFLLVVQHFTGFHFRILFALTQPDAKTLTLDRIKLELGRIVAFSLLLLVAADVLETLLKPMHDLTMEDLYKMALVGGIRTTLAFFLGKEIEEVMHHIEHSEHGHGHHHHDDASSHSSEKSEEQHINPQDAEPAKKKPKKKKQKKN